MPHKTQKRTKVVASLVMALAACLSSELALAKDKAPYSIYDHKTGLEGFRRESERRWRLDRPGELPRQRPSHLGRWRNETRNARAQQISDVIALGTLVDGQGFGYRFEVKSLRGTQVVPLLKSRSQRSWVSFLPAEDDEYFYIQVSGNDANNRYHSKRGLLYLKEQGHFVRMASLIGPKPDARVRFDGRQSFRLEGTRNDRRDYMFRYIPAGDGKHFYLQNYHGRFVGTPVALLPHAVVRNRQVVDEITSLGFFRAVDRIAKTEKPLFQFGLRQARQYYRFE